MKEEHQRRCLECGYIGTYTDGMTHACLLRGCTSETTAPIKAAVAKQALPPEPAAAEPDITPEWLVEGGVRRGQMS